MKKSGLLLSLFLALALGGRAGGEELFVPDKEKAKLGLPYRIAWVNRYERTPELPALLTGMFEKEIRAFLKMGLESLAVLEQDDKLSRQVLALIEAKGIEGVTPQDFPPSPSLDRIVLGDVRKNANLFEVRIRELSPQDAYLSPLVQISTLHPQKIGRLYAAAAIDHLPLEGYITDFDPPSAIKVALRGMSLLPESMSAPDARLIFRIFETFTDWDGKVLERRPLLWWFVEMERGRFRLIGQDFKTNPDTNEYQVSYKLTRIQLQGGRQTVRLVSEKDRERRLSGYSVFASYAPDVDKYRNLVGLSDDNGEVVVEDKERLPIYLRIEKQELLMRQIMLLVQPGAGVLEVALPEYHPKLRELVRRVEDLNTRMVELRIKLNGALRKVTESFANATEREAQLAEAEKAKSALLELDKEIKDLGRDAAQSGADLEAPLSDLKREFARRTEDLPDLEEVRAKVSAAAQETGDATKASQLETEAARLWSELKWEEAAAKYEEALKGAPPDQKQRIEQRLAVVKPMDDSHASARRFVRDELPSLDERMACDRVAEIENHVKRLADAQDTPFMDDALRKINDLNGRLVTAAGKLLKEAEQDPASAKEKAAQAQRMIETSKTLDALITKVSGEKGK